MPYLYVVTNGITKQIESLYLCLLHGRIKGKWNEQFINLRV